MILATLPTNQHVEMLHYIKASHKEFRQPNLHSHQYYEIYLVRIDGVIYLVNDKQYLLQKNDLIVLNSNDLHRAIPPKGQVYERYIVYFEPEFVQDINLYHENLLSCFERRSENFLHRVHLSEKEANRLIGLLEQPSSIEYPLLWKKSILCQILIFVNEKYKSAVSEKSYIEENILFEKINPAIKYIHSHLAEKLLLEDLAALCYMEKSYFCKIFKQATGFTAHEYISYKRVTVAETLLLQGKSVLQAGAMVGYQSSTHFSTKFKEYWGFSPKKVKRKI